jgi:hypothetical protein
MDLEFIRFPALCVFSFALALEAMLTAKLFFKRDNLPDYISQFMKWWAIVALITTSSVNAYAWIDVYYKVHLDSAVFVKVAFSLAGLMRLVWVYFFHIALWKHRK